MQPPTEKQTSTLMKMEMEVVMNLPSQKERTSRDRRSGDIVPVPAVSSSDDGPAVGFVVSLAVESTIASTSGGLEEPIEERSRSSAPVNLALQPEVRITRLEEDRAFLPPEMSTVKKARAVVTLDCLGLRRLLRERSLASFLRSPTMKWTLTLRLRRALT
ncbi:unnamed protein product [Lasius platythorax]|uniref:Uncharacterized protein n=1 Tax=Lasius platythorax TaxID=488582 RepID=A0AAV2MYJ6_9HYME